MAPASKGRRPKPSARRPRGHRSTSEAAPARYTPRSQVRIRTRADKTLGWSIVGTGIAIIVVNDVQWGMKNLTLLPGGHNELYLMLGVIVAGSGTWWLGLFDRSS